MSNEVKTVLFEDMHDKFLNGIMTPREMRTYLFNDPEIKHRIPEAMKRFAQAATGEIDLPERHQREMLLKFIEHAIGGPIQLKEVIVPDAGAEGGQRLLVVDI